MAQLNSLIVTGKSRFLNDINGNITGTATKATQDSDGNTINSTYIKLSKSSQQTIYNSRSDTPLGVKGNAATGTYIAFVNSSGTTLGYFGVKNDNKPYFYSGGNKEIITSDTIGSQSVNYATSAGSATTATKLGTSTVGGTTTPIYLNAGVPTALGYTIAKSVPSNAVFTDEKATPQEKNSSGQATYRILFGVTATNQNPYVNDGIGYVTQEGTTSAAGIARLILGNDKTSTTDKNKKGQILIYGNTGKYTHIIPGDNSDHVSLTLPISTGTIALTSDLTSKADKSATVSTIAWSSNKLTKTINGTTTDVVTASTILGNLTKSQVTTALGYTPPTTDHTYKFSGTSFVSGDNSAPYNCNNITTNSVLYYNSNGPTTSLGASTTDGALYSQAYSADWVAQIAQDYRNGRLFVRGKNNGTWQSWQRIAITGESQPASDVYSWAKASSKPSYTASEVGALATSGGTISGAVTCNAAITFGDNDSYGIFPNTHNYCMIGSKNKSFYKAFINYITVGKKSTTTGEIDFCGDTDDYVIALKRSSTAINTNKIIYLPDAAGTLMLDKIAQKAPVTVNCNSATNWANTYKGSVNVRNAFGANIAYVIGVAGYGNHCGVSWSVIDAAPSNYTIDVFWLGGNGNLNVTIIARLA